MTMTGFHRAWPRPPWLRDCGYRQSQRSNGQLEQLILEYFFRRPLHNFDARWPNRRPARLGRIGQAMVVWDTETMSEHGECELPDGQDLEVRVRILRVLAAPGDGADEVRGGPPNECGSAPP
jgi:hypothetical protein